MKRLPAVLVFLLLFLSFFAGTASAFMGDTLQNRVGDFFAPPCDCTGWNDPQSQAVCPENQLYVYELATGVVFYVVQNPWTFFDALGLQKGRTYTPKQIAARRARDEAFAATTYGKVHNAVGGGIAKATMAAPIAVVRTLFDNDNFTTEIANQAMTDMAAAKELGAHPAVGVANRYNPGAALISVATGEDFITGEKLSGSDRVAGAIELGTGAGLLNKLSGKSPDIGGPTARTISEISEPVETLYHGGNPRGGQFDNSTGLSTTTDLSHAQAYADKVGGNVTTMKVPKRVIRDGMVDGTVQPKRDTLQIDGEIVSEAPELRFDDPTVLNDYVEGSQ